MARFSTDESADSTTAIARSTVIDQLLARRRPPAVGLRTAELDRSLSAIDAALDRLRESPEATPRAVDEAAYLLRLRARVLASAAPSRG